MIKKLYLKDFYKKIKNFIFWKSILSFISNKNMWVWKSIISIYFIEEKGGTNAKSKSK